MARKNEPYIYKVLRRETPSPRQQEFFRAEAANVAYGGARGGTLRLPKQAVHDALTRYEFAAAAEGEDYVLSYRERGT